MRRLAIRASAVLIALAGSLVIGIAPAQAATCGYHVKATRSDNNPDVTYMAQYNVSAMVNGGSASGCRSQVDVYYRIKDSDTAWVKKSSSNRESNYYDPPPGWMADGGDAGRAGSGVTILAHKGSNGRIPDIVKPAYSYIRVYNGSTLLKECPLAPPGAAFPIVREFDCVG